MRLPRSSLLPSSQQALPMTAKLAIITGMAVTAGPAFTSLSLNKLTVHYPISFENLTFSNQPLTILISWIRAHAHLPLKKL